MQFVSINTPEQQDLQMLHRIHNLLVAERVALCNQIRGLLGEYGLVFAQGPGALQCSLPEVLKMPRTGGFGVGVDRSEIVTCLFETIGRQLDFETVVDAALELESRNRTMKVVLCGVGENLDEGRLFIDSGGVQKEVFSFIARALHAPNNRPCITLRGEMEWTKPS